MLWLSWVAVPVDVAPLSSSTISWGALALIRSYPLDADVRNLLRRFVAAP
jgi:hypothetical protein